jgi:hypothetical protein
MRRDTSLYDEAFSEFKLHFSNISLELRALFFDRIESLAKLIRFDTHIAEGAVIVFFKPSNLLLDLTSAARAGELEDLIVESSFHISSSVTVLFILLLSWLSL